MKNWKKIITIVKLLVLWKVEDIIIVNMDKERAKLTDSSGLVYLKYRNEYRENENIWENISFYTIILRLAFNFTLNSFLIF